MVQNWLCNGYYSYGLNGYFCYNGYITIIITNYNGYPITIYWEACCKDWKTKKGSNEIIIDNLIKVQDEVDFIAEETTKVFNLQIEEKFQHIQKIEKKTSQLPNSKWFIITDNHTFPTHLNCLVYEKIPQICKEFYWVYQWYKPVVLFHFWCLLYAAYSGKLVQGLQKLVYFSFIWLSH